MSTALSHLKHEESLNGKKTSDDGAERKEPTIKSTKSQGSGATRTPKATNVGAVMQAQETKISMKMDKKGPPNEVLRVFIDLFCASDSKNTLNPRTGQAAIRRHK